MEIGNNISLLIYSSKIFTRDVMEVNVLTGECDIGNQINTK